jgi:hypothetical protein
MKTKSIGAFGIVVAKYLKNFYGSLFDTGTNTLVLPDTKLATCKNNPQFVCPADDEQQSAVLYAVDGSSSKDVSFLVKNFDKVSATVIAASTAAAAPAVLPLFIWGLPAFFGRSVFFAIDGANAGGKVGPFVAL